MEKLETAVWFHILFIYKQRVLVRCKIIWESESAIRYRSQFLSMCFNCPHGFRGSLHSSFTVLGRPIRRPRIVGCSAYHNWSFPNVWPIYCHSRLINTFMANWPVFRGKFFVSFFKRQWRSLPVCYSYIVVKRKHWHEQAQLDVGDQLVQERRRRRKSACYLSIKPSRCTLIRSRAILVNIGRKQEANTAPIVALNSESWQ